MYIDHKFLFIKELWKLYFSVTLSLFQAATPLDYSRSTERKGMVVSPLLYLKDKDKQKFEREVSFQGMIYVGRVKVPCPKIVI